MANGRCRMHGGLSLRGLASPRYKHGRYSKDLIARLAGAMNPTPSPDNPTPATPEPAQRRRRSP